MDEENGEGEEKFSHHFAEKKKNSFITEKKSNEKTSKAKIFLVNNFQLSAIAISFFSPTNFAV